MKFSETQRQAEYRKEQKMNCSNQLRRGLDGGQYAPRDLSGESCYVESCFYSPSGTDLFVYFQRFDCAGPCKYGPLAATALLEGKGETKAEYADKDPDPKLLRRPIVTRWKSDSTHSSPWGRSSWILKGINGLSQKFLEATDKYYSTHSEALDAFQSAEGAGNRKQRKKRGNGC